MKPLPFADLLAAVLVAMMTAVAVAAAPAVAQVSGGNPPDYVLEEDGTVVIDGDVATDCPSFALALEQGYEMAGNPERAQAVLRQCEEAGFLASSDTAPSPSASSEASTPVEGLPDTGGPNILALLAVSSVAATAGGLLVRKIAAG